MNPFDRICIYTCVSSTLTHAIRGLRQAYVQFSDVASANAAKNAIHGRYEQPHRPTHPCQWTGKAIKSWEASFLHPHFLPTSRICAFHLRRSSV